MVGWRRKHLLDSQRASLGLQSLSSCPFLLEAQPCSPQPLCSLQQSPGCVGSSGALTEPRCVGSSGAPSPKMPSLTAVSGTLSVLSQLPYSPITACSAPLGFACLSIPSVPGLILLPWTGPGEAGRQSSPDKGGKLRTPPGFLAWAGGRWQCQSWRNRKNLKSFS